MNVKQTNWTLRFLFILNSLPFEPFRHFWPVYWRWSTEEIARKWIQCSIIENMVKSTCNQWNKKQTKTLLKVYKKNPHFLDGFVCARWTNPYFVHIVLLKSSDFHYITHILSAWSLIDKFTDGILVSGWRYFSLHSQSTLIFSNFFFFGIEYRLSISQGHLRKITAMTTNNTPVERNFVCVCEWWCLTHNNDRESRALYTKLLCSKSKQIVCHG